jgi:putative transposase
LCSSYPTRHTRRLITLPTPNLYTRHRFPGGIISHGLGLYFRFCLSDRDVEALMAEGSVIVGDEAVRSWCWTFGQTYAKQLRRRRPRPGDKWHLDKVCLTISGEQHYLWQTVDQKGNILDILEQRQRDKPAAKKFFRQRLKG